MAYTIKRTDTEEPWYLKKAPKGVVQYWDAWTDSLSDKRLYKVDKLSLAVIRQAALDFPTTIIKI